MSLYIEETDVQRRWGIRRRWLGCRYLSALYVEPRTPLVRIVILGWSFQIGRLPMYDDWHRRMT